MERSGDSLLYVYLYPNQHYCTMGWASGSELAEETWELVREFIPKNKRREVAEAFLDAFRNRDADDWNGDEALCRDAGRYQDEEISW